MTILGADIKQVSRSLASALPPSIVPAAPTLAAELLRSVGEIEQALNAIVADHPCRPSRSEAIRNAQFESDFRRGRNRVGTIGGATQHPVLVREPRSSSL